MIESCDIYNTIKYANFSLKTDVIVFLKRVRFEPIQGILRKVVCVDQKLSWFNKSKWIIKNFTIYIKSKESTKI